MRPSSTDSSVASHIDAVCRTSHTYFNPNRSFDFMMDFAQPTAVRNTSEASSNTQLTAKLGLAVERPFWVCIKLFIYLAADDG